ncbi:hypothetical protein D0B88_14140 [Cellvibrio sp. KY-YJ-3]|nr:hypothetical protein D0B88_14140 [Cellvibrio sp. KY-YJ-3]
MTNKLLLNQNIGTVNNLYFEIDVDFFHNVHVMCIFKKTSHCLSSGIRKVNVISVANATNITDTSRTLVQMCFPAEKLE